MDLDAMQEAISILQCCEDAASEEHVRLAMSVAIGMLLAEYQSGMNERRNHDV